MFSGESHHSGHPSGNGGDSTLKLLVPLTSLISFGLMSLLYTGVLLRLLSISGETRESLVFFLSVLLLPLLCAGIGSVRTLPNFTKIAGSIETLTIWISVTVLFLLGATVVLAWGRETDIGTWLYQSQIIICGALIIHAALTTWLIAGRNRSWSWKGPAWLERPALQTGSFAAGFAFAMISLFWVNPENPYFTPFISHFFDPRIAAGNSGTYVFWSLIIGTVLSAGIIFLARLEDRRLSRRPDILCWLYPAGLAFAMLASIICYFDFSIPINPSHYITNVGPALAIEDGRTLMVDTFSQYGPGPVAMTLLSFRVFSPGFGAAGLIVLFFNLAFYLVCLACLYRMSRLKLAALATGFFSYGALLAGWSDGIIPGYYNLNAMPSNLGFRYLFPALMVLAISCLGSRQRHSIGTGLTTMAASLWSVEAFSITLAIHIAFLGLTGLRDRQPKRMFVDGIFAILPSFAGIALLCVYTLMSAGAWPDYQTYFEFLSTYNTQSIFWAMENNPAFLGWTLPLTVIFVVMALGWRRVMTGTKTPSYDPVLRQYVPMALLAAALSAYFVGRSVPFTLIITLFPLMIICIPHGLELAGRWSRAEGATRWLTVIPFIILSWGIAFTLFTLTRPDSAYYLVLQECRDRGHCTPSALRQVLSDRLTTRPVLEQVGGRRENDDEPDDQHVVRDAVRLMTHLAPEQAHVTVLLGPVVANKPGLRWDFASDAALMYAGKWHHEPRSLTGSDQLSPRIRQMIFKAVEPLPAGELVLVRKDEQALGPMESSLLARVRQLNILCPLPDMSENVAAYRVADNGECPAPDGNPEFGESLHPE